jgi:DMSO/TMAO reductase YedYZ heme-binding membrane subunit
LKDIAFKKVLVFVNAGVPLVLLLWDWWRGQLGADPLNFVTRSTGTLTLVFLLLTLAVTPARRLTGVQWLIRFRRMLGLYAFFYGLLHFLCYLWFDKAFRLGEVVADVTRRRFILVGMLGFFLMVPLAVTSTNRMIKRLGGKRWARLHKLVYVSAAAGVLHFYLLVKADTTKPLLFAAVLAALLGYRWLASQRQKTPLKLGVSDR